MNIFVLLLFSLAGPVAGAGELNPDQKSFLQSYLGLSAKEASRQFSFEDLPGEQKSKRYGAVARDRENTIFLNIDEFRRHQDDAGLRREGTIVHEAIHLYYYNQRPHEEEWALEGAALLGEFLYDLKKFGKEAALRSFLPIVTEYYRSPDRSLTAFDQSLADSGKVFLFFLYLHQTFQGDAFSQSHFRAVASGMMGVTEALQSNPLFRLTPGAWKHEPVYVSHFYWSLINDQNTLATQANDYFTQFLIHERSEIARTALPLGESAPLEQSTTLAADSFRRYSLPSPSSALTVIAPPGLLVYALTPKEGTFEKRWIESTEFVPTEFETELLVLNPTSLPLEFQLR